MSCRLRLRLVALYIFLPCILLTASGCWDNKDINHRTLPIVMGIAKADSGFRIWLYAPEMGPRDTRMRVVSDTGTTISEIVNHISTNMSSQVDLLHLKVVLIEKPYAQAGMEESISSFIRSRDISPKVMVAICDENLEKFLNRLNEASHDNGTLLYDFFEKNAGWNPQISQTRAWQIFRSIHSYTRDVAIPIIKSGKDTVLESVGSAVVKNGRMVDRIDVNETLLFNAFNGISTQGKIEVMNHATVLVVSNTISNRGSMVDGKPHLRCSIKLKVSVLETKGNTTVNEIKTELNELLKKRFDKLFKRIQTDQADILGAGQYFRTLIPRDRLEHWRTDYFPRMEIDLRVNTIIQNSGNLRTS